MCGQNTQLRFQRASVAGKADFGTVVLASRAGIKWPRRRQSVHDIAVRSLAQVSLAPQRVRCRCPAITRSVLRRCASPKLSCGVLDASTGIFLSSRVRKRVTLARAQDLHIALCLCGVRKDIPAAGGCLNGKSCIITLLSPGKEEFCASIVHVSVVFVCVHDCTE